MNDVIIASLRQLAIESPIMLVCLTGIVLALIFWKRCPISCLFALIALIILLLISAIYPFANGYVQYISYTAYQTGQLTNAIHPLFAVIGVIYCLLNAVAIGLLITAGLLKRKAPQADMPNP